MAPRTLSLRAAVSEIRAAYRSRELGHPFFFIVGAGLSAPTVPLAGAIAEHCKSQVDPGDDVPAVSDPLDVYSYWFDRAYPQPADRQRYLKRLIQDKPIPNSTLRLAHIVASGLVSDLVVTANFDDFITRAFSLFGAHYVHCDHPGTVDRIDLVGGEIKVVHVHGSYKFYDCRNIRDELEERARHSASTTRTMAAFLDRALASSSPIVIGYSGWDGDVIMGALRRRLDGASLPYRLYWFAYTAQELSNLHARCPWLTEHPDVRIVVPVGGEQPTLPDVEPSVATGSPALLPAQLVFEELSRRFDLREPELTRDPVRFFARQARAAFASEVEERTQGNLYSFATVVARLERAADLEADDFRLHRSGISLLEPVRRLLRESRYREAVDVAAVVLAKLDQDALAELYAMLRDLVPIVSVNPDDVLPAALLALAAAGRTPAVRASGTYRSERVDLQLALSEALLRLRKADEAILQVDQLLAEAGSETDPDVQARVRIARAGKARALVMANRLEEAIREYDALIPDLRGHPAERWLLLQTQYNRAIHVARMGRTDEAFAQFASFVEEHRHDPSTVTNALVAGALHARAQSLAARGDNEEAIKELEEVSRLFGETDSIRVGPVVASSLLARTALELKAGRLDSAAQSIASFDRLCRRLALDEVLPQEVVAEAEELRQRLQDAAMH